MVVLAFLLVLLLPLAATLLFNARVGYRIPSDLLRSGAAIACYLVVLAGLAWGGLSVAIRHLFNLSDMYPVVEQPIDDSYYFTQQEYGFATMISRGYDLTFYRSQPFWFAREVGKVQVEYDGTATITATLKPASGDSIRLRIEANRQLKVDTTLSTASAFDFRHTFEGRTLDFLSAR